jgi:hypothetical protein
VTTLGGRTVALLIAAVIGAGGVLYVQHRNDQSARVARLEAEKKALEDVVGRLSATRRAADVLVTAQRRGADGVLETTLLFVEAGRDGESLAPRRFVVRGDNAHFDAMVVQFDLGLVGRGDALRGRSIALFTKVYGDAEKPEDAARVDPIGEVPAVYRSADPRVRDFEMNLWREFWTLAEDEAARKAAGVRAVVGQGIWEPLKPGLLYTLTLDNAGGLGIQRQPLRGIYLEALRAANIGG